MADGFISLGQAYMENGDYGSAFAPLKHALELKPDSMPAHQLLGYALLAQGYAGEAIPHLQIAPDKTALGIAQMQNGQLAEAVVNLQAAVRAHPNDPDVLYYMGRASGLLAKQSIDTLVAIEEISEALDAFEDIADEDARLIPKLRIGNATLDEDPEDVAAREGVGQGGRLNRERADDPVLREHRDQRGGDAEGGEGYVSFCLIGFGHGRTLCRHGTQRKIVSRTRGGRVAAGCHS